MELLQSLLVSINGFPDPLCSILFGIFMVFVVFYRRKIYIILKTLPRDLRFFFRGFCVIARWLKYAIEGETVISFFKKTVARTPDKVIMHFENTNWTVKDLDLYSNKIARIFLEKGYQKGEVVAFMSGNRPEYLGIWLGLGKIGVVTALINTNLRSQSLVHSVSVSKCRAFLFSREFAKNVKAIREALPLHMEYIVLDNSDDTPKLSMNNFVNVEKLLISTSGDPVESEEPIKPTDKLLLIYTSGTTGLPKAAILRHSKLIMMIAGFKMIPIHSNDVVYNSLPMYHSSGSFIMLSTLAYGTTIVIKPKFSARNYFADCIKYKCTVGMYIGEMCRYLLTVPPSQNDVNHSIRCILGSGMRPQVWRDFVRRYKIPNVVEVYGSTEGNANIVNFDNTIGAVGFLPSVLPVSICLIILIKYDETNGEPVRDKNGLCIKCDAGESGMCIGMISKILPFKDFQGYVDQEETKKKIIENVFKRGDSAFISGDILYMDEFGYLYFKDRIGDTFRWKGENVSTSEVEMIIQKLVGYKDCTVYGVQVGNLEGKAGMVAIADPKNEVDINDLTRDIDENLPVYARPLFLRIVPELDLTGTYKIKKVDLRNESFDPNKTHDRLFFKHPVLGFLPITKTLYNDIVNGAVKI